MPTTDLDAALLERSRRLPLATSAEVAHINAKHRPPLGLKKPRAYRDGCHVTPVYPGCLIYGKGDE